MACREREDVKGAESALREAGFVVSLFCNSRASCFDLAARRAGSLVFLKVQNDIGSLSIRDSEELRAISESLSAGPLLIGRGSREKPLEDDTVYTRHDVPALNLRTFENVLLHDMPPLIQANPGGYYVEIDGEAIKQKRQKLGLSVGEIAEMVGTSRRTIYGYERGMAKASVPAAYKLVWALGIPVARPIDIFERSRVHRYCILTTARRMLARNKLLSRIFGRYPRCRLTTVGKAPFDFVMCIPDEQMRIIGGIATDKDANLARRIEEILSISKVANAHPILVTENRESVDNDICCVSREDVSRFKSPKDFLTFFKQVSSGANPFRF